jgi:hypothetical protein
VPVCVSASVVNGTWRSLPAVASQPASPQPGRHVDPASQWAGGGAMERWCVFQKKDGSRLFAVSKPQAHYREPIMEGTELDVSDQNDSRRCTKKLAGPIGNCNRGMTWNMPRHP